MRHVFDIYHFSKIVTFLGVERVLRALGSGRWTGGRVILRYGLEFKVTNLNGYPIIIIIMFIQ